MYKLKLDRRRYKLELGRYITLREEEHNQELYELEKKLEEYLGLSSEKAIKVEEEYLRLCKKLKLAHVERWSSYDDKELDAMSDWDFYTSSGDPPTLSTSTYISPPSSLYCPGSNYGHCRVSSVLVLNVGRMVSWTKTYKFDFFFRFPCELGHSSGWCTWKHYSVGIDMPTSYKRCINPNEDKLYWGSLTDTDKQYVVAHAWRQYRVTWWKVGGTLYIRFEVRKNDNWHVLFTVSDSKNMYDTETYQRPGVGGYWGEYWDDTEIWSL